MLASIDSVELLSESQSEAICEVPEKSGYRKHSASPAKDPLWDKPAAGKCAKVKLVSSSGQLRRIFALLLACVWITSTSSAEHLSAEFPLCQPDHSPCCPLPVNSAPESCPACQVSITVAEKEESASESAPLTHHSEIDYYSKPNPLIRLALRELTPGLRYQPTVFQLKDDLRI
jgi:hypothetical protein